MSQDQPSLGPPAVTLPAQANVDFADDVGPFLRRAKTLDEPLECGLMLWSELEPSEEVERLSEIPPVIQSPSDHRQALDPDRDVVRAFFEDRASVVLRELPPLLRLPDRDERGLGRRWATERILPVGEGLISSEVAYRSWPATPRSTQTEFRSSRVLALSITVTCGAYGSEGPVTGSIRSTAHGPASPPTKLVWSGRRTRPRDCLSAVSSPRSAPRRHGRVRRRPSTPSPARPRTRSARRSRPGGEGESPSPCPM